jgi:hypothetical protein
MPMSTTAAMTPTTRGRRHQDVAAETTGSIGSGWAAAYRRLRALTERDLVPDVAPGAPTPE